MRRNLAAASATFADSQLLCTCSCAIARPGFGKNEMYPCVDKNVTYGLAVTGLLVGGAVGTTSMTVNLPYEPNIRTGETAIQIHPNISVAGLAPGKAYKILRYIGTASLPPEAPFAAPEASHAVTADAQGRATWADGAQPFRLRVVCPHGVAEVCVVVACCGCGQRRRSCRTRPCTTSRRRQRRIEGPGRRVSN